MGRYRTVRSRPSTEGVRWTGTGTRGEREIRLGWFKDTVSGPVSRQEEWGVVVDRNVGWDAGGEGTDGPVTVPATGGTKERTEGSSRKRHHGTSSGP